MDLDATYTVSMDPEMDEGPFLYRRVEMPILIVSPPTQDKWERVQELLCSVMFLPDWDRLTLISDPRQKTEIYYQRIFSLN